MERKRYVWRQLIAIMALIISLVISSLGLTACGPAAGSGADGGQSRSEIESIAETPEQIQPEDKQESGETNSTETSDQVLPEDEERSGEQDSAETSDQALAEDEEENGESGFAETSDQALAEDELDSEKAEFGEAALAVEKDGTYSDKDHVALYLHTYGHLPDNYIRKSEARDLGWDAGKGNLWDVAPGMSIGGDRFGNREGNLPDKKGRKYYECDINYEGGYRGGERIVYSDDGDIYYSEDHYDNFELLYTREGRAE